LPPTLVLLGKVRTMDPRVPEAEAVVVRGDRIVRATTEADALSAVRASTAVVRLPPGAIVLPGFVESHAHLRGVGRAAREIDLTTTTSIADAVAKVAAAAAADGGTSWIVGRGWNQERWTEKRWPTAEELEPATGGRPAALVRADGHAAWVNAAALRLAGIDAATPNPPGGEILRRADGAALGVLVDAAMEPVLARAEGRLNAELMERDFLRGEAEAFRHGITTFVDAGESYAALLTLLKLYDAGRMRLRTYGMAGVSTAAELVETLARPIVVDHRDRFTVRALKLYADGALGSRGARLLAPYADRPDALGLEIATPEFLRRTADRCLERGWQLCVHAIGDGAVRGVLDVIEGATKARPTADHRFRIEHAQHVDPADVPRFARLGVIPSMQPCHATSDFPWAAERLGRARLERTGYLWRAFLDSGVIVPAGTDAPVEPLSPFANFYAAVTRRDPQGRTAEAFTPEQRFNRLEALQALTVYGARATFCEHRRGMIAPGYDADLCVVSLDLLTVPERELLAARCLRTIVAGETVYVAP
jgi:predicted amidohydrolase YtcJ